MSDRTLRRLAWLTGLLGAGIAGSALLLLIVGGAEPPSAGVEVWSADILYAASPLVATAFGILISTRLPRHPVGWLLTAGALAVALNAFVDAYSTYGLVLHPGSVPGAVAATWLAAWVWLTNWPFFLLMLLLFPNGRLLSPRWRPVAWLAVACPALIACVSAVYPGPLYPILSVQNPVGLTGEAGNLLRQVDPARGFILIVLVLLATVASIVLRFIRATGDERQQLKWLAYAGGLAVASQGVALTGIPGTAANLLTTVAMSGVFAAIAVAILRYRLYEIDLIIRRTLAYAALTGFLAAVYFSGVVLLQQIFRVVTGQQSDLAIVGSTLAIAALFQPLRQGIQRFIDRRFYRRSYDTAQVLATFGATVRDEVDLGRLTDRLLTVVGETMQPAGVSLWLRPSSQERKRNTYT